MSTRTTIDLIDDAIVSIVEELDDDDSVDVLDSRAANTRSPHAATARLDSDEATAAAWSRRRVGSHEDEQSTLVVVPRRASPSTSSSASLSSLSSLSSSPVATAPGGGRRVPIDLAM